MDCNYMEKNTDISFDDVIFFEKDIKFKHIENKWLVISVNSGNWIVLNSDFKKKLLEELISGKNILSVLDTTSNYSEFKEFKELLAMIFSRNFGSKNSPIKFKELQVNNKMTCCLTTSCNLRCPHCYMSAGIKNKKELECSEWKRVLTEFHNNGGIKVTFTGGEPLMNKDFSDIIKHAYNLGISISVLSNGILWNDDKIKELSPFIDEIQISVDGFDEKTNEELRGINNFNKAVDTAIKFSNFGVLTYIATTFTLETLRNDIGSKYKKFVEDIGNKVDNKIVFKLTHKMLKGREVDYTKKENDEYIKKTTDIQNEIDKYSKYNTFINNHEPNIVINNCGFGGVEVWSNGEVYFCNRQSDLESYGNVREKPIKYFIDKGEELRISTSTDNVTPCKDCYLKHVCGGGCRIDDFNFKGKLKNFKDEFIQTRCNKEFKEKLQKEMIDSFCNYYKF